jgi:hypothetical protein
MASVQQANPNLRLGRRKGERTMMTHVLKLQMLNSNQATTGVDDAVMSSFSGLCPTEHLHALPQRNFELS